MSAEYLGDSVYAEFDGFGILLTTRNGLPDDPGNTIYIEPLVWAALLQYAEKIRKTSHETETAD